MLKKFFIIFLKFNFFMLVRYIPFVEVTFKSFEIIYLNRQFLLINVLNVFFQLFLRIPLISLNDAWRLETFIIALQICYVIVFLYLIICGIVFAFFFFFFFAVFLSVTKFSQDWIINFLLVLYTMIADQIYLVTGEARFLKKKFCKSNLSQMDQNWTKNQAFCHFSSWFISLP